MKNLRKFTNMNLNNRYRFQKRTKKDSYMIIFFIFKDDLT